RTNCARTVGLGTFASFAIAWSVLCFCPTTAALQSVSYHRKFLGAQTRQCLSHLFPESQWPLQGIPAAFPLRVRCAMSRSNRLSPPWNRQAGIVERLRRCWGSHHRRSIAVCAITIWKGEYGSFKPFAVAICYLLKPA